MNCPNCHAENPSDAKFCMNCGHKLTVACPNCGTELPAAARFCFNCGHQIVAEPTMSPGERPPTGPAAELPQAVAATGPALTLQRFIPKDLLAKFEAARSTRAMEGERRVVTMLFCDVKGSTAAAGQLDPEEWAEIINGTFELMIAPVYRYEGTLVHIMGDAILAFFGAPIAHEDDPRRAVLAGLDILREIQPYREQVNRNYGIDLNVRVGINTGLVVVGAFGSDLRMEYTGVGDAVNLAARMEQTTRPGTLQVAEPTYKLVAPYFEFEDLGGIEVKGKDEPVHAYRVLGVRAQPGRERGIEGLESPVVGRDPEMRALRQALTELRQDRGAIISIIGEAGLGKSRLVAELARDPAPAEGKVSWLEGRCLSYQTTTPYAPFVDMFTGHFDLGEDQPDAGRYAHLVQRIAAVSADGVDEIAPYLATMLGIGLSNGPLERVKYLEPPQLRDRIFGAIAAYLETLSQQQPLVVTIDDLHWIDPTSLALLHSLLPLAERSALLLLVLFRPHRQELSWGFHEMASREYVHRYQMLHLQPLAQQDARQLVANLLQIEDLPEKVRALILEKAEGNPFFVEEVIRSLLDAGLVVRHNGHWRATHDIESISVPNTLAAVITSRLDRLDEETRHLAQSASVIGRQFGFSVLQAVHSSPQPLDAPLNDLQRRELVREKSRVPERLYIFKHAITQETVYESLLLKRRRELHLRVAGVLERTMQERVNDIARHYLAARHPERALPFLVEAADRAAKAYATQEAIGFYRQALDILETADDLALARRAYAGLGSTLTFANDIPEAVATYQAMLARAEKYGDAAMKVSALNQLAHMAVMHLGQFEQAAAYLEKADKLARQSGDKQGLAEMGIIRCMMCLATADFDGVVRYLEETAGMARELGAKELLAQALTHIASSQTFLLQFDQARETYEAGLQLSREIGDRMHEAELMIVAGGIGHLAQGDIHTARQLAQDGLQIGRRIGYLYASMDAGRALGIISHLQGDYGRTLAYYQQYLDAARQAALPWHIAEALCLLGSVYLDISPVLIDRVTEYHNQALTVLERPGGSLLGATAWAELGFCMIAAGKWDEADQYFQKGLSIPTMTSQIERPRLLAGAALVALQAGNLPQAGARVAEAGQFAEEKGLKYVLPLVALTEGTVSAAVGDTDKALAALTLAADLAQPMQLRPIIWQAHARAAHVLAAAGRDDDALQARRAAREVIDDMAVLLEDEALRQAFVESASRKLNGSHQEGAKSRA